MRLRPNEIIRWEELEWVSSLSTGAFGQVGEKFQIWITVASNSSKFVSNVYPIEKIKALATFLS